MANDELCVLVCTPRSGHSWVTSLLRQHPQLKVFSHDAFSNHVLYLLYPIKSASPYASDGTDRSSWLEHLLWRPRIAVLRRQYRDSDGDRVLLLSTSTAVAFLPLILAAFPAAKVVHLTRDPLDVVASFRRFMQIRASQDLPTKYSEYRRLGRRLALRHLLAHSAHTWRWRRCPHPGYLVIRPPGFQEATRLPLLEFLAWYYVQSEREIAKSLADVPSDRQHSVTYEGLVDSFDEQMSALLEFLGADATEDFLARTRETVLPTSVGRHLVALDDTERTRVEVALHALAGAPTGAAEPYPSDNRQA